MIISIDFDGTLVEDDRDYRDVHTPLQLKPGAREAVHALLAAGHVLVVHSARANLALRHDWRLNPLWREKRVPFNETRWGQDKLLNERRYQQMVEFIGTQFPGRLVVDDGTQGKICADLFIDDKALRFGFSNGWEDIRLAYGESSELEG